MIARIDHSSFSYRHFRIAHTPRSFWRATPASMRRRSPSFSPPCIRYDSLCRGPSPRDTSSNFATDQLTRTNNSAHCQLCFWKAWIVPPSSEIDVISRHALQFTTIANWLSSIFGEVAASRGDFEERIVWFGGKFVLTRGGERGIDAIKAIIISVLEGRGLILIKFNFRYDTWRGENFCSDEVRQSLYALNKSVTAWSPRLVEIRNSSEFPDFYLHCISCEAERRKEIFVYLPRDNFMQTNKNYLQIFLIMSKKEIIQDD